MCYLENIKDLDDMREANKAAFKMEMIYKFNMNGYIAEYDYECEFESDGEVEDADEEQVESPQPKKLSISIN
jgi:hypothetical protein